MQLCISFNLRQGHTSLIIPTGSVLLIVGRGTVRKYGDEFFERNETKAWKTKVLLHLIHYSFISICLKLYCFMKSLQ
jgi:hypothetical protein